jgi:succinate dehydrogenase assembly factor 2
MRNDSDFIPVPEYVPRKGESLVVKRARLLYQSRKRGMLENGLILSNFADAYLPSMSSEEMDQYDHLINTPSNDWDVYYWATGKSPTPEEYRSRVMDALQEFVQNRNKENRSRQPDLKL